VYKTTNKNQKGHPLGILPQEKVARSSHYALNSSLIRRKEQALPGFIFFLFSLSLASFSDGILRTYQGSDKNGPCFLYVHREGINDAGAYQVEVSTSYQHNGQGLGKVMLGFPESMPSKTLLWERPETEESLRVLLKEEGGSLEMPQAFRVRWMHFDHLHDVSCMNLTKVVTH